MLPLPVLLGPGWLDVEQLEDAALGVGEAVQADALGGVGEPEAFEGAEHGAAGRLDVAESRGAALGGGEAVQADALGGVGEPESLEGAEHVAPGRLGVATLGQ